MPREQLLTEILYLHNVECDAYSLMSDLKNFPFPQIYHLQKAIDQQTGVILMEDFSEIAVVTGLFRSVTPGLCLNFARHFADFQAYFELMDHSKWSGRFQKNIYTRADLVESEKRGMLPALDYNDGGKLILF